MQKLVFINFRFSISKLSIYDYITKKSIVNRFFAVSI